MITQFRKENSNLNNTTEEIKREETFLNNGIYIATPKVRRDSIERKPFIPEPILKRMRIPLERPTLKQMEENMGGAGVFNFPLQGTFCLQIPSILTNEIL